ncbi:elements of external origin [Cobetia amphilecti]|uniref:major capsid protein n=1 Tax=Cobetia amphilecti TaxID=1055104 RepID=UPI000501C6AE|nr:major capsid protein [Cobetia amphilecti]KGA01019.1 elements of external origin [Cobetia amphilecti]
MPADIFSSDIFTIGSLTASINEADYVPSRLGQLGIFAEAGIATTTATVERDGDTLALVPAGERGAPATPLGRNKRTGVTFNAVHLPVTDTVLADEVRNVRAFGSEDQLVGVQQVVDTRLARMARRIDATLEWQRMGALKGKILDADGTTVLTDLYSAFGIEQKTVKMALSSEGTDVQAKALDVSEHIEDALKMQPYTSSHAFCGRSFWRKLISNPSVREAYIYQKSEKLRGDGRDAFEFGGVTWERAVGNVAGQPFVASGEAIVIPMGVPDMFLAHYAPADYNDAVNTIGLPFYSSSERLPHDKGVSLEAQSNPIILNTRPGACIRLVETA